MQRKEVKYLWKAALSLEASLMILLRNDFFFGGDESLAEELLL